MKVNIPVHIHICDARDLAKVLAYGRAGVRHVRFTFAARLLDELLRQAEEYARDNNFSITAQIVSPSDARLVAFAGSGAIVGAATGFAIGGVPGALIGAGVGTAAGIAAAHLILHIDLGSNPGEAIVSLA